MKRITGSYVEISTVGEICRAFVPHPLPPDPPLAITPEIQELSDKALVGLGRLDSITHFLPDPSLFLYMYVRKEAVLSSQIEGTQSSLSDLLLYEAEGAPGVPIDDVIEVSKYVLALNHGIKLLKKGLPLSNRLLKEVHGILLSHGRGSHKQPGDFRRSQNWIGGSRPGNARLVPPPPDKLIECMSQLEKFLHDDRHRLPVLFKAGLAHVQFETIHPFLDGNGRLGRLMISLILHAEGILHDPLLYLSLYFKIHRQEYYDLLQRVRIKGDWESWLRFFLEAVCFTSEQAVDTAKRLMSLAKADRLKINELGKPAASVLRIHDALLKAPVMSLKKAVTQTGLSFATVASGFKHIQKLGLIKELTGNQRNRFYGYYGYISLISEGLP